MANLRYPVRQDRSPQTGGKVILYGDDDLLFYIYMFGAYYLYVYMYICKLYIYISIYIYISPYIYIQLYTYMAYLRRNVMLRLSHGERAVSAGAIETLRRVAAQSEERVTGVFRPRYPLVI